MNYPENSQNALVTILKNALYPLVKEDSGILAVYLFGSLVKGTFKIDSDIDLGFVMDRSLYTGSSLKAFSHARIISEDLSLIVQRPVDVYLLNEASLFFVFDVITTGICLYEKDQDKRDYYERSLKGRYYDVMPLIANLRRQGMMAA
jgi:predicted nucleotidyltransferase